MIEIVDWGFDPSWLEYVLKFHPGGGRVMRTADDEPVRLAFLKRAEESFKERNIPFNYVKTFVSIQKPVEGSGYDLGFPHQHSPLSGTSLVHYLDPGDVPSPLHILDDQYGKVIFEFYPEPGKTVFLPHHLWHGVPKNNGTTNRIQLIASAV